MKTLYYKFIFCVLVVFVFPFTPLNTIYQNLKEFIKTTWYEVIRDFKEVKKEWDHHFKNNKDNE